MRTPLTCQLAKLFLQSLNVRTTEKSIVVVLTPTLLKPGPRVVCPQSILLCFGFVARLFAGYSNNPQAAPPACLLAHPETDFLRLQSGVGCAWQIAGGQRSLPHRLSSPSPSR